ncbi:MAG: hypothetical protein DRQ57_12365 [Gammaproteobacteria bacterium]|nr:MAG: hypothetical protein DRQ57_12365 [Gammaproteobacteria bacterium]
MSFSEYRNYKASELEKIFKIRLKNNDDLFKDFKPSDKDYSTLQVDVKKMSSRLRLSKFDNEATRGSLLVSHVLWESATVYNLGVFFEPLVNLSPEETPDLPHQLNGKYDGALSLDEIDLSSPIISVVEVKKSSLSDGLGQCIAEMYATLKEFKQDKVYGIITDGEVWEFLRLENAILSVDENNYYIRHVADIVDRIGYIADIFKNNG